MNTHVTVYSPSGEMFENVSYANARDLTTHAGWTYDPPVLTAEKPAEEPAPEPTPPTQDDPYEAADRYAALDKADMIALLKDQFGYEADGRMSLPKLVAKAVELEAEAAA